jgi:hypothetical protein
MKKDFHFYVIYALADTAGFSPEESHTIAYASQYVDDNNDQQDIDGCIFDQFPAAIKTDDGFFRPIMTQSVSVLSLVYEIQKYVYVPFHFMPGDAEHAADGTSNKYVTTPDSPNARKLLGAALKSGDLYRIGIALHTYADTWSHQNFTGYEEDHNSVFSWSDPYRAIVPNIGHADVGHAPDEISDDWHDHRQRGDARNIVNRTRALDAVKHIYQALRSATGGTRYWTEVKRDLTKLVEAEDYDDRVARVRGHVDNPDLKYEKHAWVRSAIRGQTIGDLKGKPGFKQSDWYRFQQAAKANLALTVDMLKSY